MSVVVHRFAGKITLAVGATIPAQFRRVFVAAAAQVVIMLE
jgi:hypothetical protein